MMCPYSDRICKIVPGTECPHGCALPEVCDTCGRNVCVLLDSDFICRQGSILSCWIPPYYGPEKKSDHISPRMKEASAEYR